MGRLWFLPLGFIEKIIVSFSLWPFFLGRSGLAVRLHGNSSLFAKNGLMTQSKNLQILQQTSSSPVHGFVSSDLHRVDWQVAEGSTFKIWIPWIWACCSLFLGDLSVDSGSKSEALWNFVSTSLGSKKEMPANDEQSWSSFGPKEYYKYRII